MMENKKWIYLSTAITNLVCLALGVFSGILSARLLGVQARGELAILSYYPSLVAASCSLAFPQALSFFLSKDLPENASFASAGVRLSLVFGLLGSLVFAFLAPYTLSDSNRYLSSEVSVVCAIAVPMVVNAYLFAIHRGYRRFDWVNGLLICSAFGYIVVILVLWWTDLLSAYSLVLGTILIQVCMAFASIVKLGSSAIKASADWAVYRKCLIYGFKFFFPMAAVLLYAISDRAILITMTTVEQIGYYSVAFSIAFPLSVVSETFAQLGFIEVAGSKSETQSVELVLRRFQIAQVVLLAAAVFVLLLSEPLIRYGFGKEFLPGLAATYVLVIAMALRGLSKTLEHGLRGMNRTSPGVISSLGALLCLCLVAALLTPSRGVEGFVIALLVAELVGLSIFIFFVLRFARVRPVQLWGLRPSLIRTVAISLLRIRRGGD